MAGVALAQTPTQQPASTTPGLVIQGGYASTPVTAPTVVTPHVTLTTASPNPVGATSSAYGLQVGATSAAVPSAAGPGPTLTEAIVSTSTMSPSPMTGTSAGAIVVPATQSATTSQSTAPTGGQANVESNGNQSTGGITIIGGYIPPSQAGPDVAEAARYYRAHPIKAVKTYTNDDINRMNENTATTANAGGSNLPAADVNAPAAAPSTGTMHPESAVPQADNMRPSQEQTQPSETAPAPALKSKPAPYTPPPTPPQQ